LRLVSLPPRAAFFFVTQPNFPVNPSRPFIFRPPGSTFPLPRQRGFISNRPSPVKPRFQLSPLCKRRVRGDFSSSPGAGALRPVFPYSPSPLSGEGWGGGEIPPIPIGPLPWAFHPMQFCFRVRDFEGRRFHNFPRLPDLVRAGCPPSGFPTQINGREILRSRPRCLTNI
jgi:hypothetical protein